MAGIREERDAAAVGCGDLLSKDQADARALRLGGVEGHEEVGGIVDAEAVVFDVEDGFGGGDGPGEGDGWLVSGGLGFGSEGGVDGVLEEVDEGLLELVGVAGEDGGGPRDDDDGEAGFELRGAVDEVFDCGGLEAGIGEMGEALVGLEETVERGGTFLDDGEAACEVGLIFRGFDGGGAGAEAAGDGLDGGEGVVDFVRENADEALPCEAFFLA